jgi:hypothetical protein
MSRRFAGILAIAVLSCDRATPQSTTYSQLSNRIVRLPSGDSVEWQTTLAAQAANAPPGVLVEFFPFRALADSTNLHHEALELFEVAYPELRARQPGFLVLRAVDVRTAQRTGIYKMNNFGFVFERRSDGHWYEYGTAGPRLDRDSM